MTIPLALAFILAAYLLGSIPFGLLLGRLRGVDIRTTGSGNIGATNLSRALGRRWGIAAFLLDFLKGFAPVLVAGLVGSSWPMQGGIRYQYVQIACALFSVLGHIYPAYLRFRGGKGVATTFGAITALAWMAALAAGVVWLLLFLKTRTVSIASLAAAAVFPLATVLAAFTVYRSEPLSTTLPPIFLALLAAVIITIRHRSNIRRLRKGSEARF